MAYLVIGGTFAAVALLVVTGSVMMAYPRFRGRAVYTMFSVEICAIAACTGLWLHFGPFGRDKEPLLYRPVKPAEVDFKSWQECIEGLPKLIGKPVIVPKGLAAFVPHFPAWYDYGEVKKNVPSMHSLAEYLDAVARPMGMKWNYDKGRDAVVLDFTWHATGTHSNSELMSILGSTQPAQLPARISDGINDPWRAALSDLLCTPENFGEAWKVAVLSNPAGADKIFCRNVLDENGVPHLLVLGLRFATMSPGSPTAGYCLFDKSGRFEDGGIYHFGGTWSGVGNVQIDAGQKIVSHTAGSMRMSFAVEKGHFVLEEALTNGKQVELGKYPRGDDGEMLLTVDDAGPHWIPPTPIDNSP